MKRTVTVDEEEDLMASEERPPQLLKEVVKVRQPATAALACKWCTRCMYLHQH